MDNQRHCVQRADQLNVAISSTSMTTSANELVPLVPLADAAYPTNFIRQAVCELRFPTLMALGGIKPPDKFVAALRKRFPVVETANEVSVSSGQGAISAHVHVMKAINMSWVVSLKQSSVVLEANRYTTYAEFRERVRQMLDAALPVIDSDFFTRIGLRYVNVIATDSSPMTEWINPALSAPLAGHGFRGFSEFAGKFTLGSEEGGCTLQHGIHLKTESPVPGPVVHSPDYVIDIDAFRVEVATEHVMSALDEMHQQAFSLFSWSLGDKARAKLNSNK